MSTFSIARAQCTDKTTVTRLLRTSWETVAGIIGRVVAEQIDTRRLTGLLRIGVDEVSCRKGHRYLTVVADHDQAGRVVWAAEGKNTATLEAFYDELGEAGCTALEAVSMDLGAAFKKATDHKAPQARQCVDPSYAEVLVMPMAVGNRWLDEGSALEGRHNPGRVVTLVPFPTGRKEPGSCIPLPICPTSRSPVRWGRLHPGSPRLSERTSCEE